MADAYGNQVIPYDVVMMDPNSEHARAAPANNQVATAQPTQDSVEAARALQSLVQQQIARLSGADDQRLRHHIVRATQMQQAEAARAPSNQTQSQRPRSVDNGSLYNQQFNTYNLAQRNEQVVIVQADPQNAELRGQLINQEHAMRGYVTEMHNTIENQRQHLNDEAYRALQC